ncbi:alpha/beta hydrolase [Bacillus sp. 31A1R]|uniref:Alpha/beta hydrolase n=1 Tax=Robertmurraya mangrovi TaxID=3098077 RepID=A0ABU5J274_9BACI|nr:alpha/beta hydrolase [Bacillus sp. 31A1R]MDZ5473519.1 alpha/beta hydrolase [Bacillus sp. 31A1R]
MSMLTIDDINLHYSVAGEGTPIVFVHPPLLTGENFKYQKEELSKFFKVITFDIRGHGKSNYSSTPITYELIVEDIKKLLDHLGIQETFLCGYSTGGTIVLEFLLSNFDRSLGGMLIGGISDAKEKMLYKKISIARNLAKIGAKKLLAGGICLGNSDSNKTFKCLYKEAIKGDIKNIEQYYHYSMVYNCTPRLANIKPPILLVYGEKDKQFHSYANLLHERIPNNELKFIKKAKHQIPTKNPKELNMLIKQFINRVEG